MGRKQEVYDNTVYLSAIAGGVDPERAASKRYMTILFTCPPLLVALILSGPPAEARYQRNHSNDTSYGSDVTFTLTNDTAFRIAALKDTSFIIIHHFRFCLLVSV